MTDFYIIVDCMFEAVQQKARQPSDVVLKVEADARPIKIHELGHRKNTHTVSHNLRKNSQEKTAPVLSHISTPALSVNSSNSVTHRSASTASHTFKTPHRFESKSTLLPFPTKRVTSNIVSSASGNPQKSNGLKAKPTPIPYLQKGLYDDFTLTQKHNTKKQGERPLKQADTPSTERRKNPKQPLPHTQRKASEENRLIKTTQGHHLHKGASKMGTSIETTLFSSSFPRASNSGAFSKTKTVFLAQGNSRTIRTAFVSSVVKSDHSSSHSTEHLTHLLPALKPSPSLSSTIFIGRRSKAVTTANGGGNKHHFSPLQAASKSYDKEYCKGSQISRDISPPSGKAIALGPVNDMRTCIHLSCDVGGDVAFMRSLQCFVITCDSKTTCQPGELKTGNTSSNFGSQVAFLRKRFKTDEGKLRSVSFLRLSYKFRKINFKRLKCTLS